MTNKNLRILTLNTNGLNDDLKARSIFLGLGMNCLSNMNTPKQLSGLCDMIFLQEHHLQGEKIQQRKNEWVNKHGGLAAFFEPGIGPTAGVAILLGDFRDNPIFEIEPDTLANVLIPGRALSLRLKIYGEEYLIISIYAPNIPSERAEFFEKLNRTAPSNLPIIWGATSIASRNLIDPLRFNYPNKFLYTYRHQKSDGRESFHRIDAYMSPGK